MNRCSLLAALMVAVWALPAGAADQAADVIAIRNFAFAPASLTVPAGTIVTWDNEDGEPHTVVDLGGDFRSPALDEKDRFSHRFDRPGTYKYVCSIHPMMTGTVTVLAK